MSLQVNQLVGFGIATRRWKLIAHAGASGSVSTPGATSGKDTTGANLILLLNVSDAGGTPSDNKSNTYTALTQYGPPYLRFWYCYNPTVGSGHTFTTGGTYPAICMAAFYGAAASPFDGQNGALALSPGSVTPATAGELFVAGLGQGGSGDSPSINSGFAITDAQLAVSGLSYGCALAYRFHDGQTALNPTWTSSAGALSNLAAFRRR